MKLQFKEQQFQLNAVQAVVNCFIGQPAKNDQFSLEKSRALLKRAEEISKRIIPIEFEQELFETMGYRNASIVLTDAQVLQNIRSVQRTNDIAESSQLHYPTSTATGYHLTIEMETGTGKTYTYIRTMYELHRQYGWSKFIVVVPSIAIREGVYKTFQVTQDHFQDKFGHKIAPFIYNSSKPQDIESFASDGRISVLIINTQAFNATGKDARRIRLEVDEFGSRIPIEILAQTKPILIIDEPQSVDGEKTLESMKEFNPLFTLRYSATHKTAYNKIYRLDALDAYNRKLVKKIQVKGINLKGSAGTSGYLYLEQVVLSDQKDPLALVEYEKRTATGVKRVRQKLKEGAKLFELSGEMPQYKDSTIQKIDGYFNKIEIKGQTIFAGEALGDVDEPTFRRIQIRETVVSHLTREKQLFDRGIKVLSLFFIDSVEKYRIYNEDGTYTTGEYARIFEEEYNQVRRSFTEDGLHPEFSVYLQRDDVSLIHNGYFAKDKKGRLINPSVKRPKKDEEAESDDTSAYDLIMKEKERLLSFDEPTRFIFSHSALKEGWDNPNVFQICALKHSGSGTRRRQEVGRGMRLCVNKDGIRQDYETIGDEVQEINKLTVIASESYEQFARALQSEIAATITSRPLKVKINFFAGKLFRDEYGNELRMDEEQSRKLYLFLSKKEILDEDENITPEGRQLLQQNTVPLPEYLHPFRAAVTQLLKEVYADETNFAEDERNKILAQTNRNFHKKEFQALWNRINIKTIYEVDFNSEKLVEQSIHSINSNLFVSERTYEIRTGELEKTTKEKLEQNEGFNESSRTTELLKTELYSTALYDIVGEIVNKTNLTRRTIATILKHIHQDKFLLLHKNPEDFLTKCSKLINEVKASLIFNNIIYYKTEERHDAKTIFTNDKQVLRQSEILRKHIYDYLETDSKTEEKFATSLEKSTEVFVYAKLPRSFHITTPVANYSPDWAIVFDQEKVRHIYFIAETKGNDSDLELRKVEALKIHCAAQHFKAITGNEVKFHHIQSYDELLAIVQLK